MPFGFRGSDGSLVELDYLIVPAPTGGTVDDVPAINATMAAGAALGGSRVYLQRGNYLAKSLIDYPANDLRLIGQGPGITNIVFDNGTALAKWIRAFKRARCSLENVTLTSNAAAALAAGVAVSIEGGDPAIIWNGVPLCEFKLLNVEMTKQCSGAQIIDGTGAVPCWNVAIDSLMSRWECGNNGVGLLVNTTGGLQYIDRMSVTGASGAATPPLYQARIQATKDLNMIRFSGTLGTNGLQIDPGAGQEVTACNIRDSRFDTVTGIGVNVAPNAAATHCRQIDIVDTWIANSLAGLVISGSPTRAVSARGNEIYFANGGPAIFLNPTPGATEIDIRDNQVGGNAVAIYAANNSQNFSIQNNTVVIEYGLTPAGGLQVDLGCLNFIATGNNLRLATTPLQDLSGAVNKVVANNLIT